LKEKYNILLNKPIISIGDIDDLMFQVDKVLMEIQRVTESRESWRKKYKELNVKNVQNRKKKD